MLTLPRSVRIHLAMAPVDLRKSIDGLCALVQGRAHDAYSGHLFVFTSRRGDRVKVLAWDRGGFVLYYKRLEKGRFKLPMVAAGAAEVELDATQLAMLLDGIDVRRVKAPARWEPPARAVERSIAPEEEST
jgi:transposase